MDDLNWLLGSIKKAVEKKKQKTGKTRKFAVPAKAASGGPPGAMLGGNRKVGKIGSCGSYVGRE
jgi:hypothetical protein